MPTADRKVQKVHRQAWSRIRRSSNKSFDVLFRLLDPGSDRHGLDPHIDENGQIELAQAVAQVMNILTEIISGKRTEFELPEAFQKLRAMQEATASAPADPTQPPELDPTKEHTVTTPPADPAAPAKPNPPKPAPPPGRKAAKPVPRHAAPPDPDPGPDTPKPVKDDSKGRKHHGDREPRRANMITHLPPPIDMGGVRKVAEQVREARRVEQAREARAATQASPARPPASSPPPSSKSPSKFKIVMVRKDQALTFADKARMKLGARMSNRPPDTT